MHPWETDFHRLQMTLLFQCLEWYWHDRNDFYASGNLTVYYSPHQRSLFFNAPAQVGSKYRIACSYSLESGTNQGKAVGAGNAAFPSRLEKQPLQVILLEHHPMIWQRLLAQANQLALPPFDSG